MAQFDISETVSSVKSDIMIVLACEKYEDEEDEFEALVQLIRSIESIEDRLYDRLMSLKRKRNSINVSGMRRGNKKLEG